MTYTFDGDTPSSIVDPDGDDIATSNADIIWDLDATNGLTSDDSSGQVSDASPRARLYNANDSRGFEIFDRHDGNDILNLTYRGDSGNPRSPTSDVVIYDGAGNDILALSTGSDHVYGGAGSDVITNGGMRSQTGDCNDTGFTPSLSCFSYSHDALFGQAGKGNLVDGVLGQSGADVISAGHGSDCPDGSADNDALWGGAGGDTIYGGPGSDFLYGGPGNSGMLFGGTDVNHYCRARSDEGD